MAGHLLGPWRAAPALALIAFVLLAAAGLGERWQGPELPFRLRELHVIPSAPQGSSPSALQTGDRLLSVNGRAPRRDAEAMLALVAGAREGPLRLALLRGTQRIEQILTLHPPDAGRRFALTLRTLAAIAIFLTGYWVQARRRDPLAGLFFLLTLLIGSLFALDPRLAPGAAATFLEWKGDLLALLLPAVWLHFIILFPERRARSLALRLFIYLPPLLLALIVGLGVVADLPIAVETAPARLLRQVAAVQSGVLLLLGLGVLVFKAFRRKHRRERRRIRLVLIAALFGLLPLVVFQLLHELLPGRRLGLADWIPLSLTLLPLSFAVGMLGPDLPALHHRAARLRRLLAASGILIVLFLLIRLGLHLVRPGTASATEDLIFDALALLIALPLMVPLRRRLLRRSREGSETPFQDCLRWLAPPRYFTARRELSRALLPRLGWEAEAAWLLWLERESDGAWRVQDRWVSEGGPAASITVPAAGVAYVMPAALEEALLGKRFFLAAEQWDPYWARSLLGGEALPYCKDHDWALLLCLSGDSDRPALLVLGPSRRRSLYDADIIEGLQRLVAPLELHLRNLSLVALASREERLRGEMELARRIQLELLPRHMPRLPWIAVAGRMRTSSEVGGDYYDFLELDERRLGLALGDATGHGVPAAMLIASVAMAFHAQAADGQAPAPVLTGMCQSLGRLVADRARRHGAFAGFFYGQVERDTALLRFCNAGMPAPWLFRRDGRMERLRRGGQLLGVEEGQVYLQGVLRLRPGDLLFLRSDGLEDQQDRQEEAFGEERLARWLQTRTEGDLEGLSDQLMEELTRFGQGSQDDDISFVFMRMAG